MVIIRVNACSQFGIRTAEEVENISEVWPSSWIALGHWWIPSPAPSWAFHQEQERRWSAGGETQRRGTAPSWPGAPLNTHVYLLGRKQSTTALDQKSLHIWFMILLWIMLVPNYVCRMLLMLVGLKYRANLLKRAGRLLCVGTGPLNPRNVLGWRSLEPPTHSYQTAQMLKLL